MSCKVQQFVLSTVGGNNLYSNMVSSCISFLRVLQDRVNWGELSCVGLANECFEMS